MNTRHEVDCAGEGSAWTAAVRDRDTAEAGTRDIRTDSRPVPSDENAERVSVDPLRATDRYRLVTPLPLRI